MSVYYNILSMDDPNETTKGVEGKGGEESGGIEDEFKQ
jgi:hypothetical protein